MNLVEVCGSILVTFIIDDNFPETLPGFELSSEEEFLAPSLTELEDIVRNIIENEYSCLFEIVDKLKDKLIELLERRVVYLEEEKVRQEKAEEAAREAEFVGTAKKTFEEWWSDKEKERKVTLEQIKKEKEEEANRKKGRITGKQFFMNNPRMAEQMKKGIEKEEEKEEEIATQLEEQGVDLDMFTEVDI